MIGFIKSAWKAAPVALILLAASVLVAGFFALRAVMFWVYWEDPAHRRQAIEGWMTPRYVAMSWKIPREDMLWIVGLEFREGGPRNIDQIAAARGMTTEDYIAELQARVEAYVAERGDGRATEERRP